MLQQLGKPRSNLNGSINAVAAAFGLVACGALTCSGLSVGAAAVILNFNQKIVCQQVAFLVKCYLLMRQWRNWQTRKIKDLVVVLDRGGSSPLCRTLIALGVSQVLFIAFKFALENRSGLF